KLNDRNFRPDPHAPRKADEAETTVYVKVPAIQPCYACPMRITVFYGAPFDAKGFQPELHAMGMPRKGELDLKRILLYFGFPVTGIVGKQDFECFFIDTPKGFSKIAPLPEADSPLFDTRKDDGFTILMD